MNLLRIISAIVLLALTSCGGDEPPPAPVNFAPLTFDDLTKLRLNVGDIDIENHATVLGDADIAEQSPAPPVEALTRMAHDRLFAAGSQGRAVFTIDQASLVRGGDGALSGQFGVHVEIRNADGTRAGVAEARVARQHIPGSAPEDERAVAYDLTRQMMNDMNVELEFQIRRGLSSWLVSSSAIPPPVAAEPLPAPGANPPAAAGAPILQPAIPPPDAPQSPEMSPPPGYLQPPQNPL